MMPKKEIPGFFIDAWMARPLKKSRVTYYSIFNRSHAIEFESGAEYFKQISWKFMHHLDVLCSYSFDGEPLVYIKSAK